MEEILQHLGCKTTKQHLHKHLEEKPIRITSSGIEHFTPQSDQLSARALRTACRTPVVGEDGVFRSEVPNIAANRLIQRKVICVSPLCMLK